MYFSFTQSLVSPHADIQQLSTEAQHRWLRPAEICEILRNHQKFRITPEPPSKPPSMIIIIIVSNISTNWLPLLFAQKKGVVKIVVFYGKAFVCSILFFLQSHFPFALLLLFSWPREQWNTCFVRVGFYLFIYFGLIAPLVPKL